MCGQVGAEGVDVLRSAGGLVPDVRVVKRSPPNPPRQPLGYHVEKVYNYPVICYYAGRRRDPIKRCSYAKFGEQNPILPPRA